MKSKATPKKSEISLWTIVLGVLIGNAITIFLIFLLTGLANWAMTNEFSAEYSDEIFMIGFTLFLGWGILRLIKQTK